VPLLIDISAFVVEGGNPDISRLEKTGHLYFGPTSENGPSFSYSRSGPALSPLLEVISTFPP
jgi:hypothetical protein